MWSSGWLVFDGTEVWFEVKHFETPSKYGIEEGRISKLQAQVNGKDLLRYDRSWDLFPQDALAKQALKEILKLYN